MTRKFPSRDSIVLAALGTAIVLSSTGCSGPSCEQIEHPPVTDPQTPLLIGGTYGEALATIVGTRSGPMQWHDIEPPFGAEGLPPPGETGLTVTVYEPSMAEQFESRRVRNVPNERLACNDVALFADLEVELKSDDGVLDARVGATATFHDPAEASIFSRLSGRDLGDLVLADPDAEFLLRLSYHAYGDPPYSSSGTLALHWSSSDGDGSGAGWSDDLATWTVEAQ